MKKALNAAGFFLDVENGVLKLQISQYGYERKQKRNAGRIFVISTFGLFTNGMKVFDDAVEQGLIYKVVTTNLCYQTPELLSRDYYINCDMSKYVALMIDTLNHDGSISDILDPSERIQICVEEYKKAHGQL